METRKGFEQIENLPIERKIIGAEELIERIYKGDSTPQDSRFFSVDKGGVFRYFWINDLNSIHGNEGKHFPIIEIENQIVGLAELEEDPNNSGNLWIKFISVDPQFQGMGLASQLIEDIFQYAKENNKSLETSLYSEDGSLKLKPKLKKLAEKYEVRLIELREE
jgi:GNAT superfamily N-acetyltransferase